MTVVHQCPHCELKFLNRTELEYHWAEDHPPVDLDVDVEPEGLSDHPTP